MKNKILTMLLCLCLVLVVFASCKPEPGPNPIDNNEDPANELVIIDKDTPLTRFSTNLARVERNNDVTEVYFDSKQPHSSDVRWGIATIRLTVDTETNPYFVMQISSISFFANIKVFRGTRETELFGEFQNEGLYVRDLRDLNDNALIGKEVSFEIRIAAISHHTNQDALVAFNYAGFFKAPPVSFDFKDLEDWNKVNASLDNDSDELKIVKTGGNNGEINIKKYIHASYHNILELAVPSVEGNWSVEIENTKNESVVLKNSNEAGGFKIDIKNLGINKDGEYTIRIKFDQSIGLSSLIINKAKYMDYASFNVNNIKAFKDNNAVRIDEVNGSARIAIPENGYASIINFYDARTAPVISVKISYISEGASFAIRAYFNGAETTLLSQRSETGEYEMNLNDAGLKNQTGFELRFYVYGSLGDYVDIDSILSENKNVKFLFDRIYEDFSVNQNPANGWNTGASNALVVENGMLIGTNYRDKDGYYSSGIKSFTVDLNKFPILMVNIAEADGDYKIEIKNEHETLTLIEWYDNKAKLITFDLRTLNELNDGVVTIKINVCIIGNSLKIDRFESIQDN